MTALPPDVVANLERENARLQAELRAARDRQAASAEILHTIADTPGDAEQSLRQIAETTARLFGAPSVTVMIAEGDHWGKAIRVGDGSKRIGSNVSAEQLRIGGPNLPGTVVHDNRQIHIPDLDNVDAAMAHWPGPPLARAAGAHVVSGTPLRREGRAIGALIVFRDRPLPFTAEELALQQSFADQAVIAIENARLFNETQEALARQTATADILKVIASSPNDVQPVFDVIVERAVRLCGARMGRVYRYDDGVIHLVAGHGLSVPGLSTVQQVFPRPAADDTTAGRAIRSRRPYFITDIKYDDSVPPLSRQMIEALGTRSQVTMPMLRSGEPIGAITVGWAEPAAYSNQQLALLQTFADQAVIAIENVRLFNETKEALERQTATADILKVIASSPSDVQPVFEAIATSANRLLGGFSTTVFRFIDGALHLMAFTPTNAAADNALKASFPSPVASFPLLELVHGGEAAQIPDTEASSDVRLTAIARSRGFRSMLFTPLMSNGTPIGMIGVTRLEPGSFATHHVQLLQTFADQAVIAIENVRLFDEVQARTEDLRESLQQQTATADVLKVISRSAFDLQTVFDTLISSAIELSGAVSGTICVRDGDVFPYRATVGTSPEFAQFLAEHPAIPGRHSTAGRVILSGEVVCIPDVLEDSEYRVPVVSFQIPTRSSLGVPLLRNDTVEGALVLVRTEPGDFDHRQIELVKTFADQAVIAIENVRLFDEVQARTEDLRESLQQQTATADVLKVISRSAFDLQAVFDTLISSAVELSGAFNGTICLREGEGYRYLATAGIQGAFREFLLEHPPTPGRGSAAGRVLLSGNVESIHDVVEDPEYVVPAFGMNKTRSVLGVPLLRNDKVEGALVLARVQPGPFTERQVELVQTFADQAVIAIENVRLFDEVQARTKELAASLDDLRTAQDRLVQTEKLASLGQLTAGIAHEIKNPLNFVNNFSALSAELTDELNDVLKSAALGEKARNEVEELTQMLKDNLQKIVQHGRRADSIVKNMLLHSREGSGEHRPADINALLDESLNLAYHGARAEKPQFNVTLQRDFDDKAGTIELFPQEITRVFLNLISNGFYAVTKRKTENGGTGFDPVLRATTKNLGDTVEIRIRDNGTGIPAEVKDKMFNPFFTTKPAGEGTGLGLSMSHDIIVKQHGGTIDVETEPGRFTEFRIVLPRTSHVSKQN
jgi:two-component system, NtrC family, sensor kinase